MDQASLLIAMYRHCGIPARYVVGTVELTPEQARNWAGGFDRVEDAALAYMYGGIPLSQSFAAGGGKLRALRIEHVWAEAWLSRDRYMGAAENYPPCDYDPAAPHKCARAWFALDPSFKEYDIIAPPDIVSDMGFDPETTAQQIAVGAKSSCVFVDESHI